MSLEHARAVITLESVDSERRPGSWRSCGSCRCLVRHSLGMTSTPEQAESLDNPLFHSVDVSVLQRAYAPLFRAELKLSPTCWAFEDVAWQRARTRGWLLMWVQASAAVYGE
eukprot:2054237-Amphidinium_carterae.1